MSEHSPVSPVLHVDLGAIVENYQKLRGVAPGRCGAVVKADAYGLGMIPVAKNLMSAGCTDFFVATPSEGKVLREAAPDAVIYVFQGLLQGTEHVYREARLNPVINTQEELRRWASASPPRGAALHFDTGINRLGISTEEIAEIAIAPDILEMAGVSILMTHMACADDPDNPANTAQLRKFNTVSSRFPNLETSIGNCAALLAAPEFAGDLARPGIGLYGGNPFSTRDNPMAPVVRLTAPIIQMRDLSAGERIGYGGAFAAEKDMRIATVSIGYADGVRRAVAGKGAVMANDERAPILGRISMDSIVIDVTGAAFDGLVVGDEVELIGDISVDEVAAWADTIPYEILTGIGPRVLRQYS
ncbi:MAG: alanine racemase [Pseudomonadota bacterium]